MTLPTTPRRHFRLEDLMGAVQQLARLTPWYDESLLTRYQAGRDLIYQQWLPETSLLDVGCGQGQASQRFPVKFGVAVYVGLDIASDSVREARAFHPGSTFLCGNILALPFRDKSFDVVHSSYLFHHLQPERRAEAITEQLRVARRAVILEDLFGFEPGLWRHLHGAYYRLVDKSDYRFTLKEWRGIFAEVKANIASHIIIGEEKISNRCICWVLTPGN
jgi:ubiquinone/menaquinone biosynthesis C-methylase UbiE